MSEQINNLPGGAGNLPGGSGNFPGGSGGGNPGGFQGDNPGDCAAFRDAWLERESSIDSDDLDHKRSCESCRRWVRFIAAVEQSLGGVASERGQGAPDVLMHRVAIELEEPAARFGRAFASLEPRSAPAELDAAINRDLMSLFGAPDWEPWEIESFTVKGLAAVQVQSVPPVLDRLVDEEIRTPRKSNVARWVGGLSPLSAPDLLAERIQALQFDSANSVDGGTPEQPDALGQRRIPWRVLSRPRLMSVVFVAAALLLLIGLKDGNLFGTRPGSGLQPGDQIASTDLEQRWAFRVVVVDDPSELGPQAAGLLSALSGGCLPGEAR